MEEDRATIVRVEAVLEKYCNPKKEFNGIPPEQIASLLIKAVKGDAE